MKLTLLSSKNNKWVVDKGKEFSTHKGSISKEEVKEGSEVFIGKNKKNAMKINIFPSSFVDKYETMNRGAQIITLKDIGTIIAETGINKDSIIFDCGGGSGGVTCFLANICKKVYSVEKEERFYNVIKKNIDKLELKNIKLFNDDIIENFDSIKKEIKEEVDLAVLDLKDAHLTLKNINKITKMGGYVVGYFSNLKMADYFVSELNNSGFVKEKILENIQREWKIDKMVCRPEYGQMQHTGYLIIARKCK